MSTTLLNSLRLFAVPVALILASQVWPARAQAPQLTTTATWACASTPSTGAPQTELNCTAAGLTPIAINWPPNANLCLNGIANGTITLSACQVANTLAPKNCALTTNPPTFSTPTTSVGFTASCGDTTSSSTSWTVKLGSTVVASATGVSPPTFNYTNATQPTISVTTTFNLTVCNNSDCHDDVVATVTAQPIQTAPTDCSLSASAPSFTLGGTPVTLTATCLGGLTTNTTWKLRTNTSLGLPSTQTTSPKTYSVSPTAASTYSVDVCNGNACTTTTPDVIVTVQPTNSGPDMSQCGTLQIIDLPWQSGFLNNYMSTTQSVVYRIQVPSNAASMSIIYNGVNPIGTVDVAFSQTIPCKYLLPTSSPSPNGYTNTLSVASSLGPTLVTTLPNAPYSGRAKVQKGATVYMSMRKNGTTPGGGTPQFELSLQ